MVRGTHAVMIKRYVLREANLVGQFIAEIEVQSLTHHPNTVSLIGFCEEKDELILVYDYMGNGTLKSHLHGSDNDPLLWKKRLEICINTSRALEYLHTNEEQQFVLCDLNPSNVLLDDKCAAKVATFDFSVPIPTSMATEGMETNIIGMMGVFGTKGYLDPEYLHNWMRFCCLIGSAHASKEELSMGSLRHYVNIALSCVVEGGIRRPSMNDVLRGLQSLLQMQEAWENSYWMGDELHMAHVSGFNNDIISVQSEFTIGGQTYLISNLVRPSTPISSLGYSSSSESAGGLLGCAGYLAIINIFAYIIVPD
ncbi:receptor-like protein kinase FERONIA [Rhododendron vialii]|uniref:receptor-like protein kinase FERONIA n=1 Tax=Rhododendron vialii TaxID=182163 RepID=UPI00265E4030|nr:receptor-like protein kinase FERONIA [Rhododendron vialii]